METIEIEYPETLPALLNLSPEAFEKEAKSRYAVTLYEMGIIQKKDIHGLRK